jgi:hypothetical protein
MENVLLPGRLQKQYYISHTTEHFPHFQMQLSDVPECSACCDTKAGFRAIVSSTATFDQQELV